MDRVLMYKEKGKQQGKREEGRGEEKKVKQEL